MNILDALQRLRDDIKSWVANNLNALSAKIDEKTIPIDNALSATSTNPIQNKVVASELNDINTRIGSTPVATQISNAIAAQPHFSGDYNDLVNAPGITEDESGNMVIADESGNVIFKADADGIHTTALSLNGAAAATESYVDEAIANIPEVDLTGYATETYVDEAIAAIPPVDFTGYATEGYVNEAIDAIPDVDLTGYYTKTETDSAIDAAKEELSESIVAESEEWKVVDGNGNIIFSVDADGAHTTALALNGESVEDMIEDRVASLVDSAPDTLNTLNELASALGDDPNFATTVATQIGNKVDKVDGKMLSSNDFTDDYKAQLDNPPVLADLADDESHRTVTDAEKAAWNAKSDFSGDYNDLENAPNIAEDNSGNLVITDINGNIIFRSDANGFETTQLITSTLIVDGKTIQEMIQECVNSTILGGEW